MGYIIELYMGHIGFYRGYVGLNMGHIGFYRGYAGLFRGYVGMMEKKMETGFRVLRHLT